jgi:glycosyltransferase involved in cell wall biosynthesis
VPLVLSVHDYGNACALRTMLYMDREFCAGPAPRKCLGCAGQHYGRVKGAVAVAGVLGSRRALARAASAVQCNSEFTHDSTWQHLLAGRTRISGRSAADAVIPPFPEDAPEQAPDLALLERLPESYILFVGALRQVKGVHELLEAHGRLESPPPLVLAGTREIDTPEEFPPGVTVIESMPHAAVMAAWERALFGVFPSLNPEPFGLVVLEAMSRGRATIGTSPGGHSEMIIHEESGLLVRHGDVDGLAVAMQRLIDDPALCERLGAVARQRAQLFMAGRWVSRLEELYDAAVAA